jgi:hypothetical protein
VVDAVANSEDNLLLFFLRFIVLLNYVFSKNANAKIKRQTVFSVCHP